MASDAHNPNVKVGTMMTTVDMALLHDPEYNAISKDFHQNPEKLVDEFARAWLSYCIGIWGQKQDIWDLKFQKKN